MQKDVSETGVKQVPTRLLLYELTEIVTWKRQLDTDVTSRKA
jgi:hypothetical protein